MILDEDKIIECLNYLNNNTISNSVVQMVCTADNFKNDLRRFLVDLKVSIERWDLITGYFVFHPLIKPFLIETLDDQINYHFYTYSYSMWGTDFYFSDKLNINQVLALGDHISHNGINETNIAVGFIDIKRIERLNKLKAFW